MSQIISQYKVLNESKSIFYAWFDAMHTRIDIILCDLSEEKSKEYCELIYTEIERISAITNRFDPNSELSNLNKEASKQFIKVSNELFQLIKYSVAAFTKSNGCFDITINSYNKFKEGITGIDLVEKYSSIRYVNPDIKVDLGAITKGYVLDLAVNILKEAGIESFLLNFGNSSIAAFGNHPNGNGWKVALNNEGNFYLLHNEFLSVSGNNSLERKHIIDPHTQQFIEGKKECAVVTSSGIEGEVLSTINFIKMAIK